MVDDGKRWAGRSPTELLARSLLMEMATGDAFRCLADAGLPAIVLKGPAVASWLYRPGELRPTVDIDLLVDPDCFEEAEAVLGGQGYRHRLPGTAACEIAANARELLADNGVCIDLHRKLIGLPDERRSWEVLSQRTTPLRLASGVEVAALDLGARAMHLALHAAQDGPQDVKAFDDLARGVAQVPVEVWRSAAQLAEQLGATLSFGAGLRLCPAGRRLADDLHLPDGAGVELALRVHGAPHESLFLETLARTVGWSARARLVARKLWPTSAYLRATDPAIDTRRWGTALARGRRVVSMARRTPPALHAWLRARRCARRCARQRGGPR